MDGGGHHAGCSSKGNQRKSHKSIFGFRKVRYRGLAKNLHRLEVTAALTNLYMVRHRLLRT
jgi:IS5 family transposase